MLPGGLKPVLHLADGVGNDQLVLCTEGEESDPIVVPFHMSLSVARVFCKMSSVEILFDVMNGTKSWCICTDDGGKAFPCQGNASVFH